MDELLELAACYRAAQLYAHTAHHLAKGPTFFEDHEFFGELYGTYETAFDGLSELALGLGKDYNPAEIMRALTNKLLPTFRDTGTDKFLERLKKFEEEFRKEIKEMMAASQPDGVQDKLQALAGESLDRSYQMQRRTL